MRFTDGICQKCAARVRADHLRARFDRGASADRRDRAWMPGLAAVSMAVAVALVLVARPTHELSLPPVVTVLPSPAPIEVPGTRSEDSPRAAETAASQARTPAVRAPQPRALRPGRAVVVPPVPVTWVSASALPRAAVPVSWGSAPARAPVLRDLVQSP